MPFSPGGLVAPADPGYEEGHQLVPEGGGEDAAAGQNVTHHRLARFAVAVRLCGAGGVLLTDLRSKTGADCCSTAVLCKYTVCTYFATTMASVTIHMNRKDIQL